MKVTSLHDSCKVMESTKAELEETIDRLNDECATAKAQEQLIMDKEKTTETSLLATLEQQMEAHREQHHKQLTVLRSQISEKQDNIDTLGELVLL